MTLQPVDRVAVTTVVDNSVDILRPDEKVARRWSVGRARKIADLRAEHGLAHHVEVTRGRDTVIVGICRHATRVSGVPKIHAVIGGLPPLRSRRGADRPGGRGPIP